MSRIGKVPIQIPAGVKVEIEPDRITVTGPKGTLTKPVPHAMIVTMEDSAVKVDRPTENQLHRSLHGLTRTLIHNMVVGVSEGWTKKLELRGTGYRAVVEGTRLSMQVGFSHPVDVMPRAGVIFAVDRLETRGAQKETITNISVSGIDKEVVGQLAAEIRAIKKADPYKGKGFRYQGEAVRRKAGKSGKTGGKK
ncbi:MAG: 50S ribosomal protein L6 [Armatimonadetes bacterium]|nr:50S ribosomal protein L6 [Armatimonadota bacterium]